MSSQGQPQPIAEHGASVAGIRASVDRVKCCGYAICNEICPEVFLLDDQGFAYTADAPIARELGERAREAASACPEAAILIVTSDVAT